MGQILSSPIIDKEHHCGADVMTAFGLCAMQGWRMSMEDSHIVVPNVLPESSTTDHVALYSIFDGHGGSAVAEFCGRHLVRVLQGTQSFRDGQYNRALIDAYLQMDEELLKEDSLKNDHSGCTATSILLSRDQNLLVCGNSGDSRTVLAINGLAKALSYDHKPTLPSERSRIVAADGFVEMDRVNGNLALSRAIGDFEFKTNYELLPHEQIVTCVPDIVEHKLDYENDEFVILACDGIWDCLSSQECVDLVHYGIRHMNMNLNDIASRIVDVCCSPTTEGSGIGCDNMSITIVALLKKNETLDEWHTRIKSKDALKDEYVSFADRRRAIFTHHQFSDDDELVFETTTKRPEDKFSQNPNKHARQDEEMEAGDDDNGPRKVFSLEELLSMGGIQLGHGPETGPGSEQNGSSLPFISGTALSEVLASLTRGAAGGRGEKQEGSDDDQLEELDENMEDQENAN